MRRLILTALLALVVAGVRFGLQAERNSLAESRMESAEGGTASASSSSEKSQSKTSFSMPKINIFNRGGYAKAMALTYQDQPILAACEENFEAQNATFPGKISLNDGCSCTAKYVSGRIDPEQYSDFIRHHAMILTRQRMRNLAATPAAKKAAKVQNDTIYAAVKSKSTLSGAAFDGLFNEVSDIHAICSNVQSYSPQALAKIAMLGRPQGGVEVSLRGTTPSLTASAE